MNLIIPSIFLTIFGSFNLFGIDITLFFRQFIYCLIGFLVYFLVKSIGRHFFSTNSKLFYWAFIVILVVTFIVGIEVKGSKRWLDFYFLRFQASEFFKPFFVLFISRYLASENIFKNNIGLFLKSFLYFFVPFFIIFKQPDLGNAVTFLFIYVIIILFFYLNKYSLFDNFFYQNFLLYFLLIFLLLNQFH